jgi:hypothetical protein
MTDVDDLVIEATKRAYEQATVFNGREPTLAETSTVLLQAQLAVIASYMFEDAELIEFWRNVINVIRGSITHAEAS